MRKVLALVVGVLMLVSVAAFGEGVELSEMTTSELIEKYDAVYEELLKRVNESASDISIARGQYIVGEDIKAGKYDFTCIETIIEGEYEVPHISIYKILNINEFEKQVSYTWYSGTEEYYYSGQLNVGSKVSFTLEEGMVLVIDRCDGIIQDSAHQWAP